MKFPDDFTFIAVNPREKTPAFDGWRSAPALTQEQALERLAQGGNYGVRLRACDLVVDIDPRNGGDESMLGFDTSQFPTVLTPSGGKHLYMRKPPDFKIHHTVKKLFPGIEFKTLGRQVVGPGSIHPNGKRYEFEDIFAPPFGPEGAPPMPEVLAARIKMEAVIPTGNGIWTDEQLETALSHLDPVNYADHDTWLSIMMASHEATGGTGEDVFTAWSLRDPKYSSHEKVIRSRWQSLQSGKPGNAGAGTLRHILVQAGVQDIGFDTAAEEFAEFAEKDFIEFAPVFLNIIDRPIEYIIPEISPRGILKLSHGEPRTMKSLAALEECIASATGTAAFGLGRFRPERRYKVLYLSQEDPAFQVRARTKALLAGRGISESPESLGFAVHAGIDFGSADWRRRLLDRIGHHGFDLIVIDPVRRFAADADKGPTEVSKVTAFLREITVKTGATVHIVHHDVKPQANGQDTRRRSHKASGGDWFAACEAPVAFEKLSENESIVIPESFKFSADPQPFTIRFEKEDDGRIIRLIGTSSDVEQAQSLAVDEIVLKFVTGNPGLSGNDIAERLKRQRKDVSDALTRLRLSLKLTRSGAGRTTAWFVKSNDTVSFPETMGNEWK